MIKGIGVDIIEIKRIKAAVQRRPGFGKNFHPGRTEVLFGEG